MLPAKLERNSPLVANKPVFLLALTASASVGQLVVGGLQQQNTRLQCSKRQWVGRAAVDLPIHDWSGRFLSRSVRPSGCCSYTWPSWTTLL